MEPLTIGMLVVILVLSVVVLSRTGTRPPPGTKEIPSPKAFPYIGHVMDMAKNSLNTLPLFERYLAECGNTYKLNVLGMEFIVINEPEQVKHILSTKFQEVYDKGDAFKEQYRDFLGKGIFTSTGDAWKMHRTIASALFQTSELKKHSLVFKKQAVTLVKKLQRISSKPIDVQDMFMRYTLDSFAEIGFGALLHAIDKDENRFQSAFDYVQVQTDLRGIWGDFWKYFPRDKKFFAELDYMNKFTQDIIDLRRKDSKEELEKKRDLLSQVMLKVDDNGKPLYDEEGLRDFVMNFLIAGRDTTAVTLSWCSYLLSKHPEVEKKVIEELESILGPSPANPDDTEYEPEIDWENLKKMKYLKAVLYETLRLYPPVPLDGYEALKDDVLPGGYFVPKRSVLIYSAWLLHRDPKLYPDPLAFKPERFENTQPLAYHWVPFHGGPRLCLGQEMAIQEAKIFLAVFYWRYRLRFRFSPELPEPEIKRGIILTSNNGILLNLKEEGELAAAS